MDRSQDQRSHQHDDPEHEKIRRKITQILEEKSQIMKCIEHEVHSCLSAAETHVNNVNIAAGLRNEIIDSDEIHHQLDDCIDKLILIRKSIFSSSKSQEMRKSGSLCKRRGSSQNDDEEGEDEKHVLVQSEDEDDETGVRSSHNNDVIGRAAEATTSGDDHFPEQQQKQQNPDDDHDHRLPSSNIPPTVTAASGGVTAPAATVTSTTVIALGSRAGRREGEEEQEKEEKESGNLEVVTESSGPKNDCSTGSSLDSFERNETLIHQSTSAAAIRMPQIQQQLLLHRDQIAEEGDSEAELFVIHHVDRKSDIDFVITASSDEEEEEEEEEDLDEEEEVEESSDQQMHPDGGYFTSPPPPPSSRRESVKFVDTSDHPLPLRSLSLEGMTAKISAKRKSFDHRDSHSMDHAGCDVGSDTDVTSRLSLPESLEVPSDDTAAADQPFDHPLDHRSHFLQERRSSLPRTQEVMNILGLQDQGEEEDQSLEETFVTLKSCDVESGKISDLRQANPDSETANSSSSAREDIISSVSSFATASSEIYSDVTVIQENNTETGINRTEFDHFLLSSGLKPVQVVHELQQDSEDNETGGQLQSNSHPIVPIGSHVSVRISHINTPSDFFLHISRAAVDQFLDQVQVIQGKKVAHEANKRLKEISIGLIYGIRSSADSSWSRVQVIDLFHDESKNQGFAEVFFIDHGKTAKVISDDLYCLDRSLLRLPGQAVHCCLRQVSGPSGVWSLKAIDEFRNSVSYYSMRAVFHENSSSDQNFPVDLFLDWGADEMNNVLLYLSPTEFISQQSFEHSLNQSKHVTSVASAGEESLLNFSITPCLVPSDKDYLLGVVSHAVSPSEFYLHIMSGEGNDHLDDLREHLNEHFNSSPLLPAASQFPTDLTSLKGSFWAAMNPNDNSWYRVRVIEVLEEEEEEPFADVLKGKHALVQYVDFGNVQIVPVSDLKPLTAELAAAPALCIKCHLAHVIAFESVDGGERIWSDDALTHFHELCGFENETVVTLSIVHRPAHMDFMCSLPVMLWNNSAIENEDILVNALLVSENLAYTESTEWMEDADRHSRSEGHQPASRMSSASSFRLEMSPLKHVLIDSIILLKVTSAISPDTFHAILPYGSASLDEVASMSCSDTLYELIAIASEAPVLQQLQRLHEDMRIAHDPRQSPSIDHFYGTGSLIGARSSNGHVFRGRIVGYKIEDSTYEVQDIDTGCVSLISRKRVFDMDPEFLTIPAFAVRCSLANIRPSHADSWSTDALNVFKEHTEDQFFAAHVVSVGEEDLRVELVGLDEENTISVCEYLVTLGFACESPDDGHAELRGNNNVAVVHPIVTIAKPPIPQRKKRASIIEEET